MSAESGSTAVPPRTAGLRTLWNDLRPFLAEQRWLYIPAIAFAVLTLGTQMIYPQVIRMLIDYGVQQGDMQPVFDMAGLLALILVVQAVSTYFHTYFFALAEVRVSARLKSWLFGSLVRQEVGFYDENNSGELMTRLTSDTATLSRLLKPWLSEGIRFGLMGVGAVALMIYTAPALSLVILLLGPVLWVTTTVMGRRVRSQSRHVQDRDAALGESGLATLAGIRTVRVYHAEENETRRYRTMIESVLSMAKKRIKTMAGLESLSNFSSEGTLVGSIVVGSILIVREALTVGELVTFLFYAGMVVRSLRTTSHFFAEVLRAQGSTHRVFELGRRLPRIPIEGGVRPAEAQGVIRVEDVHFSYPMRPDEAALRGVELEIPRGEMIALVGASGSGKSTLASLIARLYDPDAGRITFDGYDLRDLDPEWLRQHVTLVPSDATLFDCSVADNIRYGRPDASLEQVIEAAGVGQVREFVESLPEGYDTAAGDRGVRFSSGQKQRIAVSRAVLRGPAVLVLDEATAALDSESEALVKEGLRKLADRPTIVIVAHRLSTVTDVDRVVMIEKGQIIGIGTHQELLENVPSYRDLFEDQFLGN